MVTTLRVYYLAGGIKSGTVDLYIYILVQRVCDLLLCLFYLYLLTYVSTVI